MPEVPLLARSDEKMCRETKPVADVPVVTDQISESLPQTRRGIETILSNDVATLAPKYLAAAQLTRWTLEGLEDPNDDDALEFEDVYLLTEQSMNDNDIGAVLINLLACMNEWKDGISHAHAEPLLLALQERAFRSIGRFKAYELTYVLLIVAQHLQAISVERQVSQPAMTENREQRDSLIGTVLHALVRETSIAMPQFLHSMRGLQELLEQAEGTQFPVMCDVEKKCKYQSRTNAGREQMKLMELTIESLRRILGLAIQGASDAHVTRMQEVTNRLIIRSPLFEQNQYWAGNMEDCIACAAEQMPQFRSEQALTTHLANGYRQYGGLPEYSSPHECRSCLLMQTGGNVEIESIRKALPKAVQFCFPRSAAPEIAAVHTSIGGKYQPYHQRALRLVEQSSTPASCTEFYREFHGTQHSMVLKRGSENLELTKTFVDGEKSDNAWWIHVPLAVTAQLQSIAEEYHAEFLHLHALLDKRELEKDQRSLLHIERIVGAIHWLKAHAIEFFRGSAGVSDMRSRAYFDSVGIVTSAWRETVIPDCEALVTPFEEYVEMYPSLFAEKPHW
ncbi:MAG: hypothetical protein Q7R81_02735 [Candidatus Peregrinibacteria bacterium]|nr:hypothetical protein [Candidatus Peregrinibacteria bacterium]